MFKTNGPCPCQRRNPTPIPMTHPSEKKDQADALEKALVNDADTHRDPSASETPMTGGMNPAIYPLAYRLACHAGDDIHPDHQAVMREAATKLNSLEAQNTGLQAKLADLNEQYLTSEHFKDQGDKLIYSWKDRAESAETKLAEVERERDEAKSEEKNQVRWWKASFARFHESDVRKVLGELLAEGQKHDDTFNYLRFTDLVNQIQSHFYSQHADDERTAQQLTDHAEAAGVDPDHIDYIEETTRAIVRQYGEVSDLRSRLQHSERERDELKACFRDVQKHKLTVERELAQKIAREHLLKQLREQAETRLTHSEAVRAELAEAYQSTVGAFAVTLMVVKELHGEQDPEVRYKFAEDHSEIKIARAALARHRAAPSEKKEAS
jgi:hypothetical protein